MKQGDEERRGGGGGGGGEVASFPGLAANYFALQATNM